MSTAEKAVELFERFNCAQSVFAACCAGEELSEQVCLVVSGPFGGGMGRMGETCGAVTGAFMALGAKHGQEMASDPAQARGPLYGRVRQFADTFRERHGALTCRELTGCDLRTTEGQQEFQARDLHHTLCCKLVADAATLVAEQ
jgi:C_GCAxxG_C_C family probable redox protein